jgi:membrane-bound ClpP family serine protease
MFILDILVWLGIMLLVIALVVLIVSARLMLPISEWLNRLFRKIGLAGPWSGSRSVGIHGFGTVDGVFSVREGDDIGLGHVYVKGELWNAICPSQLAPLLRDGDTVEIVYNDDLTVTVLNRPAHTVKIHDAGEAPAEPRADWTDS